MELFEKPISVQKPLENLSIVSKFYLKNDSIFWIVFSQKETLKSLRLLSVNFNSFTEKSSPIEQFISLQELYIEDHKSECLILASSFTQL
ncbi:4627_t:CDS:1, partial [Diversispora eburnea]